MIPAVLQLASLECSYQMSITKEQEICDKMEELLQSKNKLDTKLTAKMFLKMGNWVKDKVNRTQNKYFYIF